MAKSTKLDDLLATLKQVRQDPIGEEALAHLRQALKSQYGVAVGRAAEIAAAARLTSLIPDLRQAFDRLMVKPVDRDPKCLGKAPLLKALYDLGYREDATPFLQGIHHIQREPVYGGQEDSAPALRGIAAMGLVQMNYADVLIELADLLADPELPARISAIRALSYYGRRDALPVLRLKVWVGDPDPSVISDCFAALLYLDPESSIPLVSKSLMDPSPDIQTVAALALGESHHPSVLPILQSWWEKLTEPDLSRTALLSISLLRLDDALVFLYDLLRDGSRPQALDALAALATHREDPVIWQRVQNQVESHCDPHLQHAFNQYVH